MSEKAKVITFAVGFSIFLIIIGISMFQKGKELYVKVGGPEKVQAVIEWAKEPSEVEKKQLQVLEKQMDMLEQEERDLQQMKNEARIEDWKRQMRNSREEAYGR